MEDYEKKYKDAMGMAEEIIRYYKEHNRGDENSIEDLEQIFPELKESEDEKIRKALVRFHKSTIDIDGIKGADILAWLEKQGESYTKKDVDDAYLKGISDAKNELEKQGEQKSFDYESANIQQKDFAQKPTDWWSDEDEEYLQDCIGAIWAADYYLYEDKQEMVVWLKSIKNRIGG